jgi:hypothetical protein
VLWFSFNFSDNAALDALKVLGVPVIKAFDR